MEQHPVPQNITSYEFRLVGDMTLKQFFQLAGGIVVALIIFRFPLPVLIKYPLMGLAVLVGVLMAFVPIQGRPFTGWIMAFIRAIYAPTQFTWQSVVLTSQPATKPIPAPRSASEVGPIPPAPVVVPPAPPSVPPSPVVVPAKEPEPIVLTIKPAEPIKPASPAEALAKAGTKTTEFSKLEQVKPPAPLSVPQPPSSGGTRNISAPVLAAPTTPISEVRILPTVNLTAAAVAPSVGGPSSPAISTNTIPTPTIPNIITGLVADIAGSALDMAIVEITDATTNVPARALRTNRLGQFQIATPLPNGKYVITVDKEGHNFPPTTFTAEGKIIPPIIIKSS